MLAGTALIKPAAESFGPTKSDFGKDTLDLKGSPVAIAIHAIESVLFEEIDYSELWSGGGIFSGRVGSWLRAWLRS